MSTHLEALTHVTGIHSQSDQDDSAEYPKCSRDRHFIESRFEQTVPFGRSHQDVMVDMFDFVFLDPVRDCRL